MSERPPVVPERPPALLPDESPIPPPPQRSGCLTAFMVVAGLFLLLPGLCFLQFGGANAAGGIGAAFILVALTLIIGALARATRG
jgi:hypothetical protein